MQRADWWGRGRTWRCCYPWGRVAGGCSGRRGPWVTVSVGRGWGSACSCHRPWGCACPSLESLQRHSQKLTGKRVFRCTTHTGGLPGDSFLQCTRMEHVIKITRLRFKYALVTGINCIGSNAVLITAKHTNAKRHINDFVLPLFDNAVSGCHRVLHFKQRFCIS